MKRPPLAKMGQLSISKSNNCNELKPIKDAQLHELMMIIMNQRHCSLPEDAGSQLVDVEKQQVKGSGQDQGQPAFS